MCHSGIWPICGRMQCLFLEQIEPLNQNKPLQHRNSNSSLWGFKRFTTENRWPVVTELSEKEERKITIWTASSEFGTYRLCEQRRFRRACASAQSRQNLRCSLIQAVSQKEPSDRKPQPWPLWMAGHAQLKFVMTECSKTQIAWRGSYADKSTRRFRGCEVQTQGSLFALWCGIVRIFNGCEVRIENSVTTVTVRHHEACWVMPNSYPERRNCQFAPNNHYRFFSCILFLWRLYPSMGMG